VRSSVGDYEVRRAVMSDVEDIAALIEEIERYYGAEEVANFEVRRRQTIESLFGDSAIAEALVAHSDDRGVVALASYSFVWPTSGADHGLVLKELYVTSGCRRQGLGARLMREVMRVASSRQNCTRVEWSTEADHADAQAFYRSLGFSPAPVRALYKVTV
jgi:ribosomal protein S18 acetylase RimI-like enzyme